MPAFDFGNKPTNWLSFAKDLSIISPGFLPKNPILLRRYLQDTGKQTIEEIKKEIMELDEESFESAQLQPQISTQPGMSIRRGLMSIGN